ncbi:hypothetical protein RA307_02670 [Xanthobacteraceae bacterium Astr-EGSB]|uniref:hypothetical protein n=1 Tax=Astrobacterium formosum TaxID=3069710 RepID=UPI0027B2476C|nr:hypothetical protein [Xanthobacteraceae bacterium Astr-EGSB]
MTSSRNLALPLIAIAGGVILGRLLGLKSLAGGAMTAAAVRGTARPGLDGPRQALGHSTPRRRAGRTARMRVSRKRSKPT